MVTAASPFFAFMQLKDKRCCWCFEKTFVLEKKLLFWPSEVALSFISAPCLGGHAVLVLVSCWAGSERFAIARFPLKSWRQRGLEVYRSIWMNSAWLGKLGSLSVTCGTRGATLEGTHLAVLALWTHSSWWLLFGTTFGKLFSVPRTFGFVFHNQWDKHFQRR